MATTVVICVDGLDPSYLEACRTPVLDELGRRGFLTLGRAMVPTVTNVNNVSIVTASYPAEHGICSNYRLIPETGQEVYMESGEYVLAETMFQRARRLGRRSLLVTSKDKLRTLLGDGADLAFSAERPLDWVVTALGEPPPVYSLEVNGWAIRAASYVMARRPVHVAYISTTDYAMHTYAPHEPEAQRHLTILEEAIATLLEEHPDVTLLLTADHGMAPKSRMVDLGAALRDRGIAARPVPIIKDRYVVHHSNLGGCMFVYLEDRADLHRAVDALRQTPGVERVLDRREAVQTYHLRGDRIGDLMVLGEGDVVFGDSSQVRLPPRLRSHASEHEATVPILGYNGHFDGFAFRENRDVGRYVFQRVLA